MTPGLYFWTAALMNLALVCATAILGVRCARRGEIARHRQAMKAASWLVVAFLLSYGLKIVVIGREDMSVWSTFDVWLLRVHELFVVSMLVAGSAAWIQSRKLVGTRIVTRDPKDPEPDPKAVRWHRRAGWSAILTAIVGFALAIGVLAGMYRRAIA